MNCLEQQGQKVLLVMVDLDGSSEDQLAWELAELKELVATAGGTVVHTVSQRRAKQDMALLVGKGKAAEVAELVEEHEADLVIFNQQLSPAQLRNLEEVIPAQILDRNQLILDIFAQRAMSNEGKLQVELAQLQYTLPRLTGKGVAMSRLGGGIGTRGPGETKLETDRRRIRRKIDLLREELKEVARRRGQQRKNREKQRIPLVSLVGYTNAGKTSLLQALTDADTAGEDKLFATLDTTIRQLTLPSGQQVLLSDTVGFIRHLPPQLINAFKGTLEEVKEADLILHVVDASHPQAEAQVETVDEILRQVGATTVPAILVINKMDLLPTQDALVEIQLMIQRKAAEAMLIPVSATTGTNLNQLLMGIEEKLTKGLTLITALIPFTEGQFINYLKEKSMLQKMEYTAEGIQVEVLADEEVEGQLKHWVQKG